MANHKELNFLPSTFKFSIAGIFIPGFTAIAIIGPQMGIVFLGVECSTSWSIIWTLAGIGSIVAPVHFNRLLNKSIENNQPLPTWTISTFNIIEYIFLQCILALYFTNGQTLCYVTDGQNGMVFAFTGWMAIPVLIGFSYFFNYSAKQKT